MRSLVLLEAGGVVSFREGGSCRLGHGDAERQHTRKPIEAALRGKDVLGCRGGAVWCWGGVCGDVRAMAIHIGGLCDIEAKTLAGGPTFARWH